MQRIATLTKQLLAGDRATLARAITLVESRSPKWQAVGQELVSTSVAEGKKDTAARGGGFFPFFSPSFPFLLSHPVLTSGSLWLHVAAVLFASKWLVLNRAW